MQNLVKISLIIAVFSLLFVSVSVTIAVNKLTSNSCGNTTDLEIYTFDNIYYIKDLTVTNELNDSVLVFNNTFELKNYISELTASDVNLMQSQLEVFHIEKISDSVYTVTLREGIIERQYEWSSINKRARLINEHIFKQ